MKDAVIECYLVGLFYQIQSLKRQIVDIKNDLRCIKSEDYVGLFYQIQSLKRQTVDIKNDLHCIKSEDYVGVDFKDDCDFLRFYINLNLEKLKLEVEKLKEKLNDAKMWWSVGVKLKKLKGLEQYQQDVKTYADHYAEYVAKTHKKETLKKSKWQKFLNYIKRIL